MRNWCTKLIINKAKKEIEKMICNSLMNKLNEYDDFVSIYSAKKGKNPEVSGIYKNSEELIEQLRIDFEAMGIENLEFIGGTYHAKDGEEYEDITNLVAQIMVEIIKEHYYSNIHKQYPGWEDDSWQYGDYLETDESAYNKTDGYDLSDYLLDVADNWPDRNGVQEAIDKLEALKVVK